MVVISPRERISRAVFIPKTPALLLAGLSFIIKTHKQITLNHNVRHLPQIPAAGFR